jgi:hypothetical protein
VAWALCSVGILVTTQAFLLNAVRAFSLARHGRFSMNRRIVRGVM